MFSLSCLFAASCVLALLVTPVCRNIALRLGLVDATGDRRKVHKRPVPRIGGIPILAAYAGAAAGLMLTRSQGGLRVTEGLPAVWVLLPAVLVVFLAGLLDDLFGLTPWESWRPRCSLASWPAAPGYRSMFLRECTYLSGCRFR